MSSNAWTRVDSPAHHVFSTPIEKAELDDREYRVIRLENGLQALLIHDGTTDKAAAAMDVGVGHLSDPDDIPGLAHFCEHLLFLGTKAFPRRMNTRSISKPTAALRMRIRRQVIHATTSVGSSHLAGASTASPPSSIRLSSTQAARPRA
ncbi:SubName: Full=Related to STE23-Metalloprotease involved in a-factor processing {ECO:0000313/EMBL:CCA70314.1} [Serendipita indica DSM 11827]|nr:SubName: Full=Related to STE23-Metalloprotease involved in a-factor processing {ECO:0000313/EMBL:CCA70314.1} [Serendipita indica DSM 11827]